MPCAELLEFVLVNVHNMGSHELQSLSRRPHPFAFGLLDDIAC